MKVFFLKCFLLYGILLSPIFITLGVPAQPSFGEVRTGDNAGEVILQIKTVASGVNSPNQQFRFIIVPDLEGARLDPIERSIPDYQSGTLETIVVGSLMFGESYTFSATVANTFGTSTAANSASVVAGMYMYVYTQCMSTCMHKICACA